ncbi:GntR family transcriptional regulator [Kushneria phosphatilytica]|uniref:FCD domain-containing protein n=1 Tax=Kushneria phosphatilytica TaxID=657387 RepID=A0A1S1NZF3_9GAMM|nr:FCD domain-containing protein [Kushneria phosphatilytica]OHV13864.1 GntR family transcriptional regulator [Kushneria phosphatilytica]QEL10418.1 FCD domain-containing protein [Kushneria phosphatilytica]
MTAESVSELYDALRRDLINGCYGAGEKLAITTLKKRYGVGLSPLRETLNRLAAVGLLEQSHQRGFRVPRLTRAALDDVATLRRQLEGEALEQAIARGDHEWEVELVAALHRLRQHQGDFDSRSHEHWELMHARFHKALVAGCGSPWRLRFLEQLYDQFDRYRRLAPQLEQRREQLDDQHARLVEYALARDAQQARALLEAHIELSWTVALQSCNE